MRQVQAEAFTTKEQLQWCKSFLTLPLCIPFVLIHFGGSVLPPQLLAVWQGLPQLAVHCGRRLINWWPVFKCGRLCWQAEPVVRFPGFVFFTCQPWRCHDMAELPDQIFQDKGHCRIGMFALWCLGLFIALQNERHPSSRGVLQCPGIRDSPH